MATIYNSENLRHIFQSSFNLDTWTAMLKDFFRATELRATPEKLDSNDIGEGYYLGAMDTTDFYRIGFFYYKINKGTVVNKRVGLRNLVKSYTNLMFDAALVVFNSNDHWRLSFICDIKGEATEAKRYTYVFGDSTSYYNTPVARFYELKNAGVNFNSLKEAFSVEALSKEFFEKYKDQYTRFCNYIYLNRNNTNLFGPEFAQWDEKLIRDYVKKMMGRIVFLCFLQRKGWLGGDRNYLQNLFNNSPKKANFLDEVLEPIFFGLLNTPIVQREARFAREGWDLSLIPSWSTIPYLNGGLFDKDELDYPDSTMSIELFEGLFKFLSQYNFTIDENDPNDAEVGVDPEMLGKIFENLLEDNKDKGAFYTPKEIVQYMCQESLIAYLVNYVKNKPNSTLIDGVEDRIRQLVSNPTEVIERIADYAEEQLLDLDKALSEVKICDPAIGSGAFPMGLLNELVACRENIQIALKREYSRVELKKQIILNNIYGVDIEKGAIDIARLRFWLSIVVDSERPEQLPNFDYKFMQGNSLIESFMGVDLSEIMFDNQRSKKHQGMLSMSFDETDVANTIKELLRSYFSVKTIEKKIELKQQINDKVKEFIAHKTDGNFTIQQRLNSVNVSANEDFFLWHTWFADVFEQGGFDIIIGNPPYISTKGVSTEAKKKYEAEYGFSDDTYNLFTFRAFNLLKQGGSVSYIIPKTFWTTQTKRNMRDLILRNTINYIYDTANPFDAVMVDTCIIQVSKIKKKENHTIKFLDGTENLLNPKIFDPVKQDIFINTQNSVIFKPTEFNLKIHKLYGEKVKTLYEKWWDKIKTSRDIEKNKVELEKYRANLKPGDIVLLGCLTEGGQGLATANNGKYVAIRKSSKWADNVYKSRPKKLAEAIKKYPKIKNYIEDLTPEEFLEKSSEQCIACVFDKIKEDFGRDIFGQGYIFRLIDDCEIANVDDLTEEEKENGISTDKAYYVPYDKGDKDGNRWYLETPFAIAWSKENVHFLKTNSGKKGEGMPVVRNPQFYFKEGFCWIDVNSTYLKARLKTKGVFDVLSMSLFTMTKIPDWYYVSMINSEFISLYVDNFINNTSHFQINDARQLPIIIPSKEQLDIFRKITETSILLKKTKPSDNTTDNIEEMLKSMQLMLDNEVIKLYLI